MPAVVACAGAPGVLRRQTGRWTRPAVAKCEQLWRLRRTCRSNRSRISMRQPVGANAIGSRLSHAQAASKRSQSRRRNGAAGGDLADAAPDNELAGHADPLRLRADGVSAGSRRSRCRPRSRPRHRQHQEGPIARRTAGAVPAASGRESVPRCVSDVAAHPGVPAGITEQRRSGGCSSVSVVAPHRSVQSRRWEASMFARRR